MGNYDLKYCACGCGKKVSKPQNKYIHNHHFKGKHHTEETLKKLRGRERSEETKKKMRENHADYSGENNPAFGKRWKYTDEQRINLSKALKGRVFSKEHRRKMSEAHKGKVVSKETRMKLSLINKGKIAGKKNPRYGKKPLHGKQVKYNGINFRSSWEAKYAEYLDEQDIYYEYEKHTFPVVYEYEGEVKEGTYTPDFYIPEENNFIEIKGYWWDDGREKHEAFLNQYPQENITLLQKEELKVEEII